VKAILDAGAFVAVDKRDRKVGATLRLLQQRRVPLWTTAPVIGQVWRDGRKQALLSRVLAGVGVRPLAFDDGRHAGELLERAKTDDVIDAHVALVVDDGDQLLTSAPDHLTHLLEIRDVDALLVVV
jgi:hypothetical protein